MRTRTRNLILCRYIPDAGPARQGAPGMFALAVTIGRFHLVTDSNLPVSLAAPRARVAAAAGVDVIQVRFPGMAAADLHVAVLAFREATRGYGTQVIVNDRVDVAVAAGADGVHLGQRSLAVQAARRLAGEKMIIGVSVHGVEEAIAAAQTGADYLMFGHVHATESHPGEPGRGLDGLRAVVDAVAPLPVIAIGGMSAARVGGTREAGAHGVAVIRAVFHSEDIGQSTREIARALIGES